MGIFSKREKGYSGNFFCDNRLHEKTAISLIKKCEVVAGIHQEDVKAILAAAAFPTTQNYLLCTNDTIIIMSTGGMMFKASKYALQSITAISLESESPVSSHIILTIGGDSLICDIGATAIDTNMCFEYLQTALKNAKANSTSSTSSVADEIMKFKQLLDIGAITQSEYDAKKSELLGQ